MLYCASSTWKTLALCLLTFHDIGAVWALCTCTLKLLKTHHKYLSPPLLFPSEPWKSNPPSFSVRVVRGKPKILCCLTFCVFHTAQPPLLASSSLTAQSRPAASPNCGCCEAGSDSSWQTHTHTRLGAAEKTGSGCLGKLDRTSANKDWVEKSPTWQNTAGPDYVMCISEPLFIS